jgi:hypothetical protein
MSQQNRDIRGGTHSSLTSQIAAGESGGQQDVEERYNILTADDVAREERELSTRGELPRRGKEGIHHGHGGIALATAIRTGGVYDGLTSLICIVSATYGFVARRFRARLERERT